ncbi:MAG TPA: 16S rRNA (cytidine(1402)-2'-O)-methyltransferase [Acidimicrobiia bacterium]|nr:16S rRNA (cytidine(1402)-2'-O)-methyltransferase [Acidimicrobiia bacterium]
MPGRLYICATPIGNLGDVSPRLAETLAAVDVVYAEDTRRSGRLLAALGIEAHLRSFFVGNERRRAPGLEDDLRRGSDIALITDAGMPAVSDPGALAVETARRAGAEVVVIPGPSAVTAAVAGSGMVAGRFVFEGFLARSGRERARQLERIAAETDPSVVFLSPHRAAADLTDLAGECGPEREVCVARELTKLHEELWWGTLAGAAARWSSEARGEFTIVVAGQAPTEPDPEAAVDLARRLVAGGVAPSRAARDAAAATGVPRRQIYEELVR